MTSLAIIIPVLDEADAITDFLTQLEPFRCRDVKVIVVDGGSADETRIHAQPLCDQLITSERGRARQMNAGAQASDAEVLLFLHADTRLPDQADELVTQALTHGAEWGRFDVRIAGRSSWLPVIGAFMNLRSRLTGIATGDQAIFVRRSTFATLGGYADMPLMEDIELSSRLCQIAPPSCLSARVTTSGRRWDTNGAWRTIFLMWRLRLRYFLGADPRQLAIEYGYGLNKPPIYPDKSSCTP